MDSAQEVGVSVSEQGPKAKRHLRRWAPPRHPCPHLEPQQGWEGPFCGRAGSGRQLEARDRPGGRPAQLSSAPQVPGPGEHRLRLPWAITQRLSGGACSASARSLRCDSDGGS